MSPEVLAAKFDAMSAKLDATRDELREDIRELKVEARDGLANVNATLTAHNGRLRKVEEEQIRRDARSKAANEQTERFARYKVPIVTTVVAAPIAALLTMGITALVFGGLG